MILAVRIGLASLVLALAPASAGASTARPPVALTASPAHVTLAGSSRSSIRITNGGTSRAVVDVIRAGFALDLRGRPKIVARDAVARSAAGWLSFRPRSFALMPGESKEVAVASRLPSDVEPGDHDALIVFTTRRRARDGVAVRMRMGIVVVVRAPGAIVRRLGLQRLHVRARGRARVLELGVSNRGNVTEGIDRTTATLSLSRDGRQIARLRVEPRDLRPGTRGVLQFVYRGIARGPVSARVDVVSGGGGSVLRRTFRVRL